MQNLFIVSITSLAIIGAGYALIKQADASSPLIATTSHEAKSSHALNDRWLGLEVRTMDGESLGFVVTIAQDETGKSQTLVLSEDPTNPNVKLFNYVPVSNAIWLRDRALLVSSE